MGVKKEIDWEILELYAKSGCKQVDICKSLHIDEDTLRSRVKEKYDMEWSVFSASLRSEGNMLIEAHQFQKAMKGYWPALLWLGKVRLGQKEPDMLSQLPANQQQIDQTHRIMELEHQLSLVKNDNNDKS